MRPKRKNKLLLIAVIIACSLQCIAQDSAQKSLSLKLDYYVNNNNIQWLIVNARSKTGKKFEPVKGAAVNLYLSEELQENLIAELVTDESGKAKAFIPPSLQALWDSSVLPVFIASSKISKQYEEASEELTVTRAKINLDTITDGETRSITVSLKALKDGNWVPASDVEMKIGIRRTGGSLLSAGEEETYTTDSTGVAIVELNKDSLPGDANGNLILIAKVENHDEYGNLLVEKIVPWGITVTTENNFFDQRTLWSTRYRTPPWLLLMAYSIVIGVWSTMIYLVLQIVKIKKLSKQSGV